MSEPSNAVHWFEIPTTNLERAASFYQTILGVELMMQELGPLRMAWFPMNLDAPGSMGSLVQAEGYTPSHAGTMVYFGVDDINGVLEKVVANGGKILRAKQSIGPYGFVGHFEDTEGNRVALHSME